MHTMRNTITFMSTYLTHLNSEHTPMHITTYTPPNSEYKAPTMRTCPTTCTCKGAPITTTTHMEDITMHTHNLKPMHTCTPTCTCMGTYTTPTHYRPTHRAYMLAMVIITMLTMGAYTMYTHTPTYTMVNGWSFITMVVSIPLLCMCAWQYHTHRTHYTQAQA